MDGEILAEIARKAPAIVDIIELALTAWYVGVVNGLRFKRGTFGQVVADEVIQPAFWASMIVSLPLLAQIALLITGWSDMGTISFVLQHPVLVTAVVLAVALLDFALGAAESAYRFHQYRKGMLGDVGSAEAGKPARKLTFADFQLIAKYGTLDEGEYEDGMGVFAFDRKNVFYWTGCNVTGALCTISIVWLGWSLGDGFMAFVEAAEPLSEALMGVMLLFSMVCIYMDLRGKQKVMPVSEQLEGNGGMIGIPLFGRARRAVVKSRKKKLREFDIATAGGGDGSEAAAELRNLPMTRQVPAFSIENVTVNPSNYRADRWHVWGNSIHLMVTLVLAPILAVLVTVFCRIQVNSGDPVAFPPMFLVLVAAVALYLFFTAASPWALLFETHCSGLWYGMLALACAAVAASALLFAPSALQAVVLVACIALCVPVLLKMPYWPNRDARKMGPLAWVLLLLFIASSGYMVLRMAG